MAKQISKVAKRVSFTSNFERFSKIERCAEIHWRFLSICPKATKEKPADNSVTVSRRGVKKSDGATYLARCNDLPRSRTRRGKASRDLCRLLTECLQAQPGRGLPVVSILLLSSCFSFSPLFFLSPLPPVFAVSTLFLSPPFYATFLFLSISLLPPPLLISRHLRKRGGRKGSLRNYRRDKCF